MPAFGMDKNNLTITTHSRCWLPLILEFEQFYPLAESHSYPPYKGIFDTHKKSLDKNN